MAGTKGRSGGNGRKTAKEHRLTGTYRKDRHARLPNDLQPAPLTKDGMLDPDRPPARLRLRAEREFWKGYLRASFPLPAVFEHQLVMMATLTWCCQEIRSDLRRAPKSERPALRRELRQTIAQFRNLHRDLLVDSARVVPGSTSTSDAASAAFDDEFDDEQ